MMSKILASLVAVVALGVGGYTFYAGSLGSSIGGGCCSKGKTATALDCCTTNEECCEMASSCCLKDKVAVAGSSDCCAANLACCETKAACCDDAVKVTSAACCYPGSPCCDSGDCCLKK